MAKRSAVAMTRGGRLALFACAVLAALVLSIDFIGEGARLSVKPSFATHDHASDQGKGHTDKDKGGSGGAGSPGEGDGDDDDPGRGREARAGPRSDGGSGGSSGAADAEEQALSDAIGAVDPVQPPQSDAAESGVPTIRDIVALPPEAVVGPDEERALIANGWVAQ